MKSKLLNRNTNVERSVATMLNRIPSADRHQFLSMQALNVFFIRAAIVIGPTPPGTGVI